MTLDRPKERNKRLLHSIALNYLPTLQEVESGVTQNLEYCVGGLCKYLLNSYVSCSFCKYLLDFDVTWSVHSQL